MNTKTSFELPNKKVRVRYIKRKKGMASNVPDNHVIAGGMLSDSTRKICVPLTKQGVIKNILTNEEKEFFENEMDINLSVYKNKEFWANRRVTLIKGDTILDLGNMSDYIDYKILLANNEIIAENLNESNKKLTYQFVIIEEGEENKLKRSNFSVKKKAFKLYAKIEDSKDILRSIIKLIEGKSVAKTADIEWLRGKVESIVDEKPEQFVALMEDANYGIKMIISNAEDAGVIVRKNKRYSTSDGIELSKEGEIPTFENAVNYLADPMNQEVLDLIEAKTKKANK